MDGSVKTSILLSSELRRVHEKIKKWLKEDCGATEQDIANIDNKYSRYFEEIERSIKK